MGNQAQKNTTQQQPQTEYRINHPILQQTQIYPHKNIMKTHLPSYEDMVIDSWMKSMDKIKQINKEYLLLPKTILFRENALCGTYSSLTVMYDCYPYVLMDQVTNRRKIDGTFQEDQIWYLIWVLVDASKRMINLGQKIGDIRPHNILFNETGDVKVINKFSWPAELTNYSKTLYERVTTYLSPEQLQLLVAAQEKDSTQSPFSESFSIGLTILSVMFLEDLSRLYQFDPLCYGINTNKFASLLQKLPTLLYFNSSFGSKLPYSHGLIRVVQRLCDLDVEKRLGVGRLWEWLKPHKDNIVNFKPFELIRGISEKISPDTPVSGARPPEPQISLTNSHSPIHLLQQSHRNSHQNYSANKIHPQRTTHIHPQPIHSYQVSQKNSSIRITPSTAHQLKNRMNPNSVIQHQIVRNQHHNQNNTSHHVDYAPATHNGNYQKQAEHHQIRNDKTTNITFSDEKKYKLKIIPPINTETIIQSRAIHSKNNPAINFPHQNKIQTVQKIYDTYEDDDIIAQVDRQLTKSKKLFPAK